MVTIHLGYFMKVANIRSSNSEHVYEIILRNGYVYFNASNREVAGSNINRYGLT